MVATRRSLAQANQTPKVEKEPVPPPAKSEDANDTKKDRKRKAKDEIVEEDAEEKTAEDVPSKAPQNTAEKSKRARRRHRAALKRQDEARTRDGNLRQQSEDGNEEEG